MDYATLLKCGIEFRESGNFEAALASFVALVERYPNDIRAYIEAGATAKKMGNGSLALDWLDRAEKISDTNFWPYYLRFRIKYEEKDFVGSLDYLYRAAAKCRGRVSANEYNNILKSICDTQVLVNRDDPRRVKELLRGENYAGRPIHQALRVSLVKDEEDIIYYSLKASYINGIRYFVIGDNLSNDRTVQEVLRFEKDYEDCIVYLVRDPVVEYFQAAKTMALVRLGITMLKGIGKDIRWIFALDADEVLHNTNFSIDLHELLMGEKGSVADLMVNYFCNASSEVIYNKIEPGQDIGALFPTISTSFVEPVRKVAFRYNDITFLEQGNHFCIDPNLEPSKIILGPENGFYLLHYPIRSLRQVASKVGNGGIALKALGKNGLGNHWRADYETYIKRGDEFLEEKILRFHAKNAKQG